VPVQDPVLSALVGESLLPPVGSNIQGVQLGDGRQDFEDGRRR